MNNTREMPVTWSIDTVEPTVADASTLSWSSPTPFNPVASLTDSHSLSILQQLLVVAGVGMGIGGALMASLAYELFGSPIPRPPRPAMSAADCQRHGPALVRTVA